MQFLSLPILDPLEHLHTPPNPETKTHFVKICRSHNGRGCPFSVTWPPRSRRWGRCVLTRKSEIALTSGKTKRSFKCPYELWRQSLFIWVDPKNGELPWMNNRINEDSNHPKHGEVPTQKKFFPRFLRHCIFLKAAGIVLTRLRSNKIKWKWRTPPPCGA